jgi:alpha-L-rhamnosidase
VYFVCFVVKKSVSVTSVFSHSSFRHLLTAMLFTPLALLAASAPSAVPEGSLTNSDWSGASWVRRDSADKDDYTYYRKKITLPAKSIEQATIYISGTHHYVVYLNGTLVGKGQAYHYPQYQYYRAFDVTALVKPGADNQFALFNHWFGGGQGRPSGERGVLLKAVIRYTDGSVTTLGTDASWLQSRATAWVPGQPDRNRDEGVGYIECIDARELHSDWTSATFDDSAWSPVTVIGPHPTKPWTGTLAPDFTRIEESVIAPAAITDKGNGKYIVDLGKVWAGLPRIRFSGGTLGTTVTMRGGYVLNADGEIPEGTLAQSTLMEYRAILDGGDWVYEPVEFLGMRYFQIDNAPMPVTADTFAFVVRHTALDAHASAFESSDATLNAVWDLMKHSLFTCAQEEFLDTPTREKGGFLGDSILQSTVAMPVLGERALTRRTLGEFLQSMDHYWSKPADLGRINAVYPNGDGARDIPDFTQAYLTWVWTYYLETGDRTFLADNYAHFKTVADYVHRHINTTTGLVTNLTGGKGPYQHGIVDWPASMRYGYDMKTDARTVINGWAYSDFDILSQIAGVIDNTSDRDTYRAHADALAAAINGQLLNADGVYIDGLHADGTPSSHVSQHANMFPLALGIVPAKNRTAVIDAIKARRMSVGMVTVRWLVQALGESDQGPHLIDLYTNKHWDGWAQSLSRGATATWESWDADKTGDSLSHAWGAAGLEGYYRYILGIRPLKPGYDEVLIHPLDFGDKLNWAKGRITTDHGPISVHWIRTADTYNLRVTLPAKVTARIALPVGARLARARSVTLDGNPVPFSIEANHLIVTGVGPGEHTLIRQP